MLQALSETVQGISEAGNGWQQRATSPSMMANHQDSTLAAIPKAVRLEFLRFKGENPSS